MSSVDNVQEQLPLGAADFHILLALSDGCLHGYAIMQDVADLSQGQVTLGPGTLYGALKRLVRHGWLVETDPPPDAADDARPRRYYELTGYGRRILVAELQRVEHLLQLARRRRLIPESA